MIGRQASASYCRNVCKQRYCPSAQRGSVYVGSAYVGLSAIYLSLRFICHIVAEFARHKTTLLLTYKLFCRKSQHGTAYPCVLGDLNEQLESMAQGGVTGRWTGGPASANSGKIADLLRLNNLIAANTTFQPKKHHSVCTYLQTTAQGNEDINVNDFGAHVNQTVKAEYKRR